MFFDNDPDPDGWTGMFEVKEEQYDAMEDQEDKGADRKQASESELRRDLQ